MARELKPCGTHAAYKRHLRNKEEPCEPCRQAARDQKNERMDGDRGARKLAVLVPAPVEQVDVEVEYDPLTDAKENLRLVNVAMSEAVPREVAALSRRRQELVALIAELGGKKEVTLADELAEFRRRRSGA